MFILATPGKQKFGPINAAKGRKTKQKTGKKQEEDWKKEAAVVYGGGLPIPGGLFAPTFDTSPQTG